MKITKKTILLGILIYLFLCLTYYILAPKYDFYVTFRYNKITGKVQQWNNGRWETLK